MVRGLEKLIVYYTFRVLSLAVKYRFIKGTMSFGILRGMPDVPQNYKGVMFKKTHCSAKKHCCSFRATFFTQGPKHGRYFKRTSATKEQLGFKPSNELP